MAILGFEGMDGYTTYDEFAQGSGVNMSTYSGTPGWSIGGGRYGGNALDLTGASLRTPYTAVYHSVGFNLKLASGFSDFTIYDCSNTYSYVCNKVVITSTGSVVVYGGNNLYIDTAFPPGTIKSDKWFYFSVYSYAAVAGTITVRINTARREYTNVSTLNGGEPYLKIVGASTDTLIDDIALADSDITTKTVQQVKHLYPVLDRTQADWSTLSAGSGYAEIAEQNSDGDGSYIYATTLGSASEFDVTDLATTPDNIAAIKIKTSSGVQGTAGTTGIQNSIYTSLDTEVVSTIPVLTDGVYTYESSDVIELNPDTGLAFTASEINGLYTRHEVI